MPALLPYNPAIPLLGIYLEENMIGKDICTPVFITALLTIVKTWKQPKCPLTEERIKKIWFKYTMEYCPAIKGNEISAICSDTNGPRNDHTEISKSDRKGEILCDIPCIQNLNRNDTNKLIYKTETYPQA